jgi:major membrane immunogen (membrane-anchored lipoprotein)
MTKAIITLLVFILVPITGDGPLKDGTYKGSSRAKYTNEPYYGFAEIKVESGKLIKVDFSVRDSSKHVYFDETYEKYFAGNEEYIQQCRNDWKGIQSYPDSLLKYQDLDQVDVISGATWSYDIFKASAQIALSAAGN